MQYLHKNATISYCAGVAFLLMSKIKHETSRYTPRDKSGDRNPDADYAYTTKVVTRWLKMLESDQPGFDLAGKSVLELGPGDSLGTGAILLGLGAERYAAYDVIDLAAGRSVDYYAALLRHHQAQGGALAASPETVLESIAAFAAGDDSGRLRFAVSNDFDFSEFRERSIDLVVSQAAFEHFRDPVGVIDRVTPKCRPGAVFLAVVDLITHSRWLRRHDPLNIYRLHQSVYDSLSHIATPNRVRPETYREALEAAGWIDVRLTPFNALPTDYVEAVRDSVLERFRDDRLDHQSLVVTARRP